MLLLSYPIHSNIPTYANGDKPKIHSEKQISCGDSCNTLGLSLSNHHGTHVDCPLHFDPDGLCLTDYAPEFWSSSRVQVLKSALKPREICTAKTLDSALGQSEKIDHEASTLILYTGWHLRREEEAYWNEPPGFDPEIGHWLRKSFPKIRFFGFDLLSLSSLCHREMGRRTHRALLGQNNPILILEDLDLSPLENGLEVKNLLVSPLMIQGADGAPCTLWANLS
jgi:arylformamidase